MTKRKTCCPDSERMPQTPYPWTSSWNRNIQLVMGFADAVTLVCDMTSDEHKAMLGRRAMRIENSALQDALVEHGAYLGDILDWIQVGIKHHNECTRVPETFVIKEPELATHKSLWIKHVTESRQSLAELKTAVESLVAEVSEKRRKFESEDTGGYSSYSDYSEDETDSDEEEEIDDGFDDEEEEYREEDGPSQRRRPADDEREKRRNRDGKH